MHFDLLLWIEVGNGQNSVGNAHAILVASVNIKVSLGDYLIGEVLNHYVANVSALASEGAYLLKLTECEFDSRLILWPKQGQGWVLGKREVS
jgi:hypothetical protein